MLRTDAHQIPGACADDPALRTVESFEAERTPTVLYLGRPQAGGWSMERTVEVGDVIPAIEGTEWVFFWQVPGVLLGPYAVADVTDTCGPLPTSGPGAEPRLLSGVGFTLVLAGAAMVLVAHRPRRQFAEATTGEIARTADRHPR